MPPVRCAIAGYKIKRDRIKANNQLILVSIPDRDFSWLQPLSVKRFSGQWKIINQKLAFKPRPRRTLD